MSEWQPISTAPKDGTRFLAYGPLGRSIAQYGRDCGRWYAIANGTLILDGDRLVEAVDVTHWTPLPEPPDAGGE